MLFHTHNITIIDYPVFTTLDGKRYQVEDRYVDNLSSFLRKNKDNHLYICPHNDGNILNDRIIRCFTFHDENKEIEKNIDYDFEKIKKDFKKIKNDFKKIKYKIKFYK